MEFLKENPDAYAGASGVSDLLFNGVDEGLNLLFGFEQQSFLQGYLPISTLTLVVTNKQVIGNEIIETGPSLRMNLLRQKIKFVLQETLVSVALRNQKRVDGVTGESDDVTSESDDQTPSAGNSAIGLFHGVPLYCMLTFAMHLLK